MNVVESPRESNGRGGKVPLVGGLVLLAAIAAALWGISTRARALAVVTQETRDLSVPTVAITSPERGSPTEEITLPGTIHAYSDASIYARTNGYLKKWYADIGTHVRAGQRLAEIDAPEVDQQLQQARADLATAEANAKLAQSTAERYRDLIKSDSVSKQDLDNANGSLEAKQAAVDSARFNVKRLEEMQSFSRVEAPFSGVVTARNVDVGALISPTNATKELFHVAATDRLRVMVNVPEVYSRAAKPGLEADLTLKEFPGRRFKGTLARTADAIDIGSRTLLTEVDVDNPKGELLIGSFADVHLKLPTPASTLKVSVGALIFKSDGLQVAAVDPSGKVSLINVTPGRDYGNAIEIVAGLQGDERLIMNPPDALSSGQTVKIEKADR
jgi:RND family efflux transporter MFP subunit